MTDHLQGSNLALRSDISYSGGTAQELNLFPCSCE